MVVVAAKDHLTVADLTLEYSDARRPQLDWLRRQVT